MNKTYTQGVLGLLALLLTVGVLSAPFDAQAAPPSHAKAWGYYHVSPGHMKQEYRHEYRYENDWDEARDRMEEFRSWFREYLNEWRAMRMGMYQSYEYASDTRVVTGIATEIEEDRATLRAQAYLGSEDSEAEVWFEYGTSASDLDITSSKVTIDDAGSVERTIVDLDEDTHYYYRAVIEDEDGKERYGTVRSFWTRDSNEGDDVPTLTTRSAVSVEDDRATLRGSVDMQDFDNGLVFFVYGTDKGSVEDVADKYDEYDAILEDGDDLQKVAVDQDQDDSESYEEVVTSLNDDTLYYYAIGVAYEDEDGDDVLMLGSTRSLRTDE